VSEDLIINARVTIPASELEFTASRASGQARTTCGQASKSTSKALFHAGCV
jgi:hypothetical protein